MYRLFTLFSMVGRAITPILMGVTPTFGVMSFLGLASKMTYSKDVYLADVADSLIKWDGGAGSSATSPSDWMAPEPVVLRDFSIVTGPTVIFKIQITRDGVPTGDILRLSIHLTTLNNRPVLNIPFAKGSKISAIEKV